MHTDYSNYCTKNSLPQLKLRVTCRDTSPNAVGGANPRTRAAAPGAADNNTNTANTNTANKALKEGNGSGNGMTPNVGVLAAMAPLAPVAAPIMIAQETSAHAHATNNANARSASVHVANVKPTTGRIDSEMVEVGVPTANDPVSVKHGEQTKFCCRFDIGIADDSGFRVSKRLRTKALKRIDASEASQTK